MSELEEVHYLDHLSLPKLIGQLVRQSSEFAGVGYSATRPKEPGQVPHISYQLVRRIPGNDGVETVKPRFRYSFPSRDNSIVEVWSQWMTCIFQWDVMALTAQEADELCWKLERLIRNHVGLLQQLRVQEMIFEEQLQDHLLERTPEIETRSIRFKAILNSFEERTVVPITELHLNLFLAQSANYEAVVRGPDLNTFDILQQRNISRIICVSAESVSGIARTSDYLQDLDYEIRYDPMTRETALRWLEAGKNPDPGETYYVRYQYWDLLNTIYLPAR